MKKLTVLAATALALAGGLAGCHRGETGPTNAATNSGTNTGMTASGGSTAPTATGSNTPTAQNSGTSGATNGQDLAAGNMAGTNTQVAGNQTGATSPGDYGASSSNPGASTNAMGAGANGQAVFTQTCAACHAAGIAGAPKVGDKAAWGPRIAQGKNVLYTHALQGFTGKTGTMPPKGGNTSIADADVKAAVDYMVAQAQK